MLTPALLCINGCTIVSLYHLQRVEAKPDKKVCRPVDRHGDRGGDGPARLREQLGHKEPGDGAGPGGEPHHEEDDCDDGEVGDPGVRVLTNILSLECGKFKVRCTTLGGTGC